MLAWLSREGGATALPAPKKSLERTIFAFLERVSLRSFPFGMTTTAVMVQGNLVIGFVLVRSFFITTPEAVVPKTKVVSSDVCFWNVLNEIFFPLARTRVASATPAAWRLASTRRFGGTRRALSAFLERDRVRMLLVSASDGLQPIFDRGPGINPVKDSVLPCIVNVLVGFEDCLVLVVERHLD